MGIKRTIYDQIGGFSNLRHGQDIEFSYRVHKSGLVLNFDKCYCFSSKTHSLKQFFKQVYNWV